MVRRIPESELPPIEELIARLKLAHTKQEVTLSFKDGSVETGAVTYVERLGTGRIIDVVREFSRDYNVHELSNIELEARI
jgi:hypothetical protein